MIPRIEKYDVKGRKRKGGTWHVIYNDYQDFRMHGYPGLEFMTIVHIQWLRKLFQCLHVFRWSAITPNSHPEL